MRTALNTTALLGANAPGCEGRLSNLARRERRLIDFSSSVNPCQERRDVLDFPLILPRITVPPRYNHIISSSLINRQAVSPRGCDLACHAQRAR